MAYNDIKITHVGERTRDGVTVEPVREEEHLQGTYAVDGGYAWENIPVKVPDHTDETSGGIQRVAVKRDKGPIEDHQDLVRVLMHQ
ncbi:hypothetical protein ACFL1B_05805 [Nanoarchaeota archaeon]